MAESTVWAQPLGKGVSADPRPVTMARWQSFALEATNLEQRGLQLERRQVVEHGAIEAGTLDELMTGLADLGPLQIAPTVVSAIEFFTPLIETAAQRQGDARFKLVLAWRDGVVNRQASRVLLVDED